MLRAGRVLQNRYRIVSLLGEGGQGAVYRAWDTRLGVAVALKEMTPQPGLDPRLLAQLRQQFEQEAQVLARLTHPHLVRVTDFFEEGGNAYLVMNFVEGENLAERVEREGALAEAQVVGWGEQLLDALGYCHEQGVIHRDVKPQNVIIQLDGQVVLADFGLVKLWDPRDPRTKTAMRGMGTPEYAPPEQYDAEVGHTDPRSDIYSLGATLYHALAGQAPRTASERMAFPDQFLSVRQLNPTVSRETDAAVLRAIEVPVANRFQDAREMAAELKGRVVPAATPPALARLSTKAVPRAQPVYPRFRVPGWLWLVGGLGVVALCCLVSVVLVSAVVAGTGSGRAGGAAPGTATLTLHNNSSSTACYVYISPVSWSVWGDDWLGPTEVVYPGGTRVFDVPVGDYDLRADDCSHNVLDDTRGVTLSGSMTWTITGGGDDGGDGDGTAALILVNNSGSTVCYVYISPVSWSVWGDDWLGPTEVVHPGGTRVFDVPAGDYDLRADDCSHNVLDDTRGVTLSGSRTWTIY